MDKHGWNVYGSKDAVYDVLFLLIDVLNIFQNKYIIYNLP